ncbi:DODA-type extradiol aromatic ring-opening family dioxygenase [Pseudoalteromonas sp. GB56]
MQLTIQCQGAPQLAQTIIDELVKLDVRVEAQTQRGLDHGVFVPLAIMYPSADIPCVQVSLHQDYESATSYRSREVYNCSNFTFR